MSEATPAEVKPKARMRDRDDWKKIQEKTFTNWFNDRIRGHLKVAKVQVLSLETDLEDGIRLIELLEKLTTKTLGRYNKNPRQKVQKIENLGTALQFIYSEKIKLVNIGPEDIHGGNLKLILGLIWTLIKTYQIKFTGKGISTKKAMLDWVNSIIPEYHVTNFNTDWNDGRCLCGIVDHIRPGACPNHQALDPAKGLENCQLGTDLAGRMLGIPKVVDPVDLNHPSIDELSVMTYLSYFCTPSNALLLDWIRKKIPRNNIKNLSTDWNNGINLGALGEACFPGLCPDWSDMDPANAIKNNEKLLGMIQDRLGLKCPISASELANPKVDELIIATYLSQFRNAKLRASPEEFGLRVPSLPHGSALVKEPVTFAIDLTAQTANMKKDISVTAHGPSSDVKVNLKPKGDFGLEALLVPTEAGSYDVMAVYQDENISGSPFTLPVADPSKCAIFGDIPANMQVGEEEAFIVKTRDAGIAQLTCSTVGDKGALSSDIKEQENEQFEIKLIPKEIGQAKVNVQWASTDIPRTPFSVNVCDASKASISGTKKDAKVGEPFIFQVQAKEDLCGKGTLKIKPRGPGTNYDPDVKKTGDGKYDVSFVPWEVGPHKVGVDYGGGRVPGSPFSVNVAAAPDAKTCSASGKGLKRAIAGEKASFQIFSPESGLLGKTDPVGLAVMVESPTDRAQTNLEDRKDGSYNVNYTAPTPGSYDIKVKFYDRQIPGSPFKLDVVPRADASKCKAYGPALHPNSLHIAGNPLDMYVDSREAGTGDLRVTVVGPEDTKPKVYMANESGTYSMKWDVPVAGRYHAHIWWEEQYIPGSPFKIKVSPGPNAGLVKAYGPGLEPSFEFETDSSDFTIETKDAGIGTLTVRVHGVKGAFKIQAQPVDEKDMRTLRAYYHPNQAGDYIIAIRWSGSHVPGSPFKVNIRDQPTTKPKSKHEVKEKEKVDKMKPLPPNIYMSHQGDSQTNPRQEIEEDDDETPEPTPLSVVEEKKSKTMKSAIKSQSQVHMEQQSPAKDARSASISLPANKTVNIQLSSDAAIREQQMSMLQHKGALGADIPPGGLMVASVPRTQTKVVTKIRHVKKVTSQSKMQDSSSSSSSEKKKKRKF